MLNNLAQYINSNTEILAELINDYFDKKKIFFRNSIINTLRSYIEPLPAHYVWVRGDNVHDSSGKLIEDGKISLDQTISSFLENEYSGNTDATYEKGEGLHYNTYGDELQYEINELAGNIMGEAICEHIKDQFGVVLTDEDFEYLQDACDDFQDIYDECIVFDFFAYEAAIEFSELGGFTLMQLIK